VVLLAEGVIIADTPRPEEEDARISLLWLEISGGVPRRGFMRTHILFQASTSCFVLVILASYSRSVGKI
jgi:hypothetical protein